MNWKELDKGAHFYEEKINIANKIGYNSISEAYYKLFSLGIEIKEIALMFNTSNTSIKQRLKKIGVDLDSYGGARNKKHLPCIFSIRENGKQQRFYIGRKDLNNYMHSVRCAKCKEIVFQRIQYNKYVFSSLRNHKGCIKKNIRFKGYMSKALISTYISIAFNDTIIDQFKLQNIDSLTPEMIDICQKIKIAIKRAFNTWRGKITRRQILKADIIEKEMAKRTFLSKETDIVALLSFGIGLLEDLMSFLLDKKKKKSHRRYYNLRTSAN